MLALLGKFIEVLPIGPDGLFTELGWVVNDLVVQEKLGWNKPFIVGFNLLPCCSFSATL